MIGVTVFVVAILIIAIWVIIELKRFKHKVFAIILIALILFTYISFSVKLNQYDLDLKTIPGITNATKLYFTWLGSAFKNLISITTYAIRMDWKGNETTKIE